MEPTLKDIWAFARVLADYVERCERLETDLAEEHRQGIVVTCALVRAEGERDDWRGRAEHAEAEADGYKATMDTLLERCREEKQRAAYLQAQLDAQNTSKRGEKP